MNKEKNSTTHIGLDAAKSEELTQSLNNLLANYQVFYMNIRGFHWNIKGAKFFELHLKFEELYTELLMKIDELAERVLTLGGTPTHSYSSYLADSQIREAIGVSSSSETVRSLLNSFEILLAKQRLIMDLSDEANDEGTNSLMSDYIREQEKHVWMYGAFLSES